MARVYVGAAGRIGGRGGHRGGGARRGSQREDASALRLRPGLARSRSGRLRSLTLPPLGSGHPRTFHVRGAVKIAALATGTASLERAILLRLIAALLASSRAVAHHFRVLRHWRHPMLLPCICTHVQITCWKISTVET